MSAAEKIRLLNNRTEFSGDAAKIAAYLGLSADYVRSALSRARRGMRGGINYKRPRAPKPKPRTSIPSVTRMVCGVPISVARVEFIDGGRS